jgi:hypothetical protein
LAWWVPCPFEDLFAVEQGKVPLVLGPRSFPSLGYESAGAPLKDLSFCGVPREAYEGSDEEEGGGVWSLEVGLTHSCLI